MEDALRRGGRLPLLGLSMTLTLSSARSIYGQDFGSPTDTAPSADFGASLPTATEPTPTNSSTAAPSPADGTQPTTKPAERKPSTRANRKTQRPGNPKKSESNLKPEGSSKAEGSTKPSAETPANSSTMAKGQVRGLFGSRLQLNVKNFPDIAVGQIFVVEGKIPGQILAHVEIIQVSRSKKVASAKVNKRDSGIELTELLNLSIYREKDYKSRYADANITSLVAPDALAGRNNLFSVRLSLTNSIPPVANLITGVSLNQSVTLIGSSAEFFIPKSNTTQWLNKFGLQINYLQSLPVSVVGRVSGSVETQSLKLTSNDLKFSLVFKTRPSGQTLSEFWVSAGYQLVNTKANIDTNVGAGNTEISFSQKGAELALGGDFSPLPFLYLGGDFSAGIPQKYTAQDSSNASSRTGKWEQFRLGVFGDLRYPVGPTKTSVLSFQIKGGLTADQIEVPSNDNANKERFFNPFYMARLGFSAG